MHDDENNECGVCLREDQFLRRIGGSEKSLCEKTIAARYLLGAGILGDGFCSFADGVLGKFSGQKETNSSLDLSASDRRAAIVVRQSRRFCGDTLEDVVDEAVHDGHCLAGDASVGMNLLEDFVNVDGIRLPPSATMLLVACASCLGFADGLLCAFGCWFRWHVSVR